MDLVGREGCLHQWNETRKEKKASKKSVENLRHVIQNRKRKGEICLKEEFQSVCAYPWCPYDSLSQVQSTGDARGRHVQSQHVAEYVYEKFLHLRMNADSSACKILNILLNYFYGLYIYFKNIKKYFYLFIFGIILIFFYNNTLDFYIICRNNLDFSTKFQFARNFIKLINIIILRNWIGS
jgi:hypothetical protein